MTAIMTIIDFGTVLDDALANPYIAFAARLLYQGKPPVPIDEHHQSNASLDEPPADKEHTKKEQPQKTVLAPLGRKLRFSASASRTLFVYTHNFSPYVNCLCQ